MKNQQTNKEEIQKDVEKYSCLETISNSEAGKILVEYLENGISTAIDELLSKYKDSSNNLIPIIAQIDEKLNLLKIITRAEANKDLAIEALKNEEKREQES